MALPRCSSGQVSDTSAAPLVHSPPMPSPSRKRQTASCQIAVVNPHANVKSEYTRRLPTRAGRRPHRFGNQAEEHTAKPGCNERQRTEQARDRLAQREILNERAEHERVQHDVEAVERPTQPRRKESAPRRHGGVPEPLEPSGRSRFHYCGFHCGLGVWSLVLRPWSLGPSLVLESVLGPWSRRVQLGGPKDQGRRTTRDQGRTEGRRTKDQGPIRQGRMRDVASTQNESALVRGP